MLIWIDRISQRLHMNYEICDAVMDIQIGIGLSHIQLEEGLAGDAPLEIEKISDGIDLAISLAEAALHGGKNEHGQPLRPLKDSKLRKEMGEIHSLLSQFKTIALERIEGTNARNRSVLSERFDAVFKEIRGKSQTLEIVLEKNQIRAQSRAKRLFSGILFTWILVLVSAMVALWSRETRRRAAEKALQKANVQLQAQAEELEIHRGHLTELVEGRTAELTFAVRSLEGEIAERKQAEKSLRESENKCRILVDYLPQKIYLKDQNLVYTYCNDNFAQD
jgi:PAS domain-containing protein